ncbi:MAG: hypothetical protein HWD90_11035 [Campylobacteraceae bacterium]|nr:hypothetical protein [Campylobacteraceae bacterium]
MGVNEIVDKFNIGFFKNNTKNTESFDLNNIIQDPAFKDFDRTMMEIGGKEPYVPSPDDYAKLEGFTYGENGEMIPTTIVMEGQFTARTFLDEEGKWDTKAENEFYRKEETEYKKEVISDWLQNQSYDLRFEAKLMKALLAKTYE